ncbi:hypothetical protein BRADI_5g07355v3 [Brachypodium distachyon]|uniref:Uncharacterized protein n=1 Tax=Brachypodium distachyon TaxID=15368 RepID=A0A0Q3E337_BRADI|nr:hypothetical protein BRADI_5g07355v3 [Brachypodium distachyon]PNT60873.1 hypothetical protein BRADI_5g07355v3 [Brachypodium distachyon]PNT60874.1 hypothetical protein BRADI_5g07355v3 [Brachypodium distachyon]PNT60875.1 hypothetical protein BRADI_5g07355v3 [Brachypodium distachyon]PNT60876.1 hypothetical protein BRADI_5g07355v3 [Brachypodium distachyon]
MRGDEDAAEGIPSRSPAVLLPATELTNPPFSLPARAPGPAVPTPEFFSRSGYGAQEECRGGAASQALVAVVSERGLEYFHGVRLRRSLARPWHGGRRRPRGCLLPNHRRLRLCLVVQQRPSPRHAHQRGSDRF